MIRRPPIPCALPSFLMTDPATASYRRQVAPRNTGIRVKRDAAGGMRRHQLRQKPEKRFAVGRSQGLQAPRVGPGRRRRRVIQDTPYLRGPSAGETPPGAPMAFTGQTLALSQATADRYP